MPRGRLTERYVRDAALKWLVSYYDKKQIFQGVISQREVGVSKRNKLGYGRADGLIVAQLEDGKIFTASLEAKSSRTFFNIIPWYKDERWVVHSFLAGIIGLLLAAIIAWSLGSGWFWVWILPLIVFVVVGIGYLLITSDFSYYRPINVVAQVKGYPANEQWIAISTDIFNQLGAEGERALRKDCQKEGIGIIRISASEKTTSLVEPKARKLPRGCEDFLECYTRGRSLHKKLQLEIENMQLQDVLQNEGE
jgi:hypothetical protein